LVQAKIRRLYIFAISLISIIILSPFLAVNGNAAESSYEIWHFSAGGSINTISAAGDVSGDGIGDVVMGSDDRKVYMLDGKTGEALWSYAANQPVQWVTPLDMNQVMVLAGSKDNSVFLLDSKGALVWKIDDIGNNSVSAQDSCYVHLRSIHVISDINDDDLPDVVVVSSSGDECTKNSRFTATALNTADGSNLWEYKHEQELHGLKEGNAGSSPVAVIDLDADGVLDLVLVDDHNVFYVIDGLTGQERATKQVTSNGEIWSLAVIPDVNGDGVQDALGLHFIEGGGGPDYARVSVIDLDPISEVWKVNIGDGTYKSGAVFSATYLADKDSSQYYLAIIQRIDDDLHVALLDGTTGQQKWKFNLGTDRSRDDFSKRYPVVGVPDLDGDSFEEVAAGSIDSTVYLLNGGNGQVIWKHPLNNGINALDTITQDDRTNILVGDSVNTARVIAGLTEIKTTLTANVSSESAIALSRLTVSGRLSPTLPGETLELLYKDPDGKILSNLVVIAKDGSYTDTIFPEKEGSWTVYAIFKGEGYYTGSQSPTLQFTVTSRTEMNTFNLRVDDVSYPIRYSIEGGSIRDIAVENTSIKVDIDTTMKGTLSIHLPRNVIDARDSDYVVSVDDKTVLFKETEANDEERILLIPFPADSREITITGTYVVPEFDAIAMAMLSLTITMVLVIRAVYGRFFGKGTRLF
jgi:outer membrane protein assembly factor BamB